MPVISMFYGIINRLYLPYKIDPLCGVPCAMTS